MHWLDSFPPGGTGRGQPLQWRDGRAGLQRRASDNHSSTRSTDILFMGLTGDLFRRRHIRATENAARRCGPGGVVVVFPAATMTRTEPTRGERDRLQRREDTPARHRSWRAVAGGVIGGQESQLYLSRGTWLARRLGLSDCSPATSCRSRSAFRSGSPRDPTLICRQDRHAGVRPDQPRQAVRRDPICDAVDEHMRSVMQQASTTSPPKHRFPILG